MSPADLVSGWRWRAAITDENPSFSAVKSVIVSFVIVSSLLRVNSEMWNCGNLYFPWLPEDMNAAVLFLWYSAACSVETASPRIAAWKVKLDCNRAGMSTWNVKTNRNKPAAPGFTFLNFSFQNKKELNAWSELKALHTRLLLRQRPTARRRVRPAGRRAESSEAVEKLKISPQENTSKSFIVF